MTWTLLICIAGNLGLCSSFQTIPYRSQQECESAKASLVLPAKAKWAVCKPATTKES